MATLYTVLRTIQAAVSAATTGLISMSPDTSGKQLTVLTGIYWPSEKTLQDNVRKTHPDTSGPTALITVYDRGIAADSTRWSSQITGLTVIPSTMAVMLSAPQIPALGSVTLTFAGPLSVGDAVGVVLSPSLMGAEAVVPIAVIGDTAESMAGKLQAMIVAHSEMAAMVSASVSGAVVTLTSLMANGHIEIKANVGNGGIRQREVARRKRHFQIVIWCRTPDDRITVGDKVEMLLASAAADFGLTFPDGTMGRLLFTGDTEHDEATLSDVMRRDFMISVDYGITTSDQTWTILAPIGRTAQL